MKQTIYNEKEVKTTEEKPEELFRLATKEFFGVGNNVEFLSWTNQSN